MIDLQLLRLMRVRSDFNKARGAIKLSQYDSRTRKIIKALDKYYKTYPSHGQIEFESFIPLFDRLYSEMDKDDKAAYKTIFKNIAKGYPSAEDRAGILSSIAEHDVAHTAFDIVSSYNDGDDVDVAQELGQLLDRYKLVVGTEKMPEVGENIDSILDDLEDDEGVHWRLQCINDAMRPLKGGDFGIIAARPDQGKTSFLASELSYMASQLPEGRPILWLNNEGNGSGIQLRVKQAALGATVDELVQMKDDGTLYDKYYEAVGGENRVRVMNIHGYNTGQVEALVESISPGIIVFDMLDNVRGFGDAARNDLKLELMYQWGRELGVKYDAIGLATSQISADGANLQYPGMSLLKDSKTGKQGACDFQIMIGSLESKPEEYGSVRWVSAPKNKLRRLKGKHLNHRVSFNRDKALFKDGGVDTGIIKKEEELDE